MTSTDNKKGGVTIDGLDMIDIITIIDKKKSKYLALALQDLEDILGSGTDEFTKTRKIVLDNVNSYTRSLVRALLGDIEIERYTR